MISSIQIQIYFIIYLDIVVSNFNLKNNVEFLFFNPLLLTYNELVYINPRTINLFHLLFLMSQYFRFISNFLFYFTEFLSLRSHVIHYFLFQFFFSTRFDLVNNLYQLFLSLNFRLKPTILFIRNFHVLVLIKPH